MNLGFKWEPALIAEAIKALITVAVLFGLNWTTEQVAGVMTLTSVILALFVRQSVTSQDTLVRAGTSQQEIVAKATANTSQP